MLIRLLLLFSFMMTSVMTNAEQIAMTACPIDVTNQHGGLNKTPAAPLYVDFTGYVLTFPEDCVGFIITIVDEDGDTVYANVIGSTGVVMLPNDLTGSYTLQVISGNLMYSAEIEL